MEKRLNEAPCGFITLNKHCNMVAINETMSEWLRIPLNELKGRHIESLLTSANRLIFHSYFYPTIQLKGEVEGMFIQLKTADGALPFLLNAKRFGVDGEEFIDCYLMPMKKRIDYELELKQAKQLSEAAYVEKERALVELQHLHDEIEQKQSQLLETNAQLLALSNTDKLTGIANRRLFQQQLDNFIDRYHGTGKTFSVLLLDIDFFKKVNDTYGHLVGDIVLKELAQLLTKEARSQDVVARYGGEEFVVLLPDVEVNESNEIAWAFNRSVDEKKWPEIGSLTISIGAATFKEGYTADSVLELADQALYKSKQDGRNRVTHYDQEMRVK